MLTPLDRDGLARIIKWQGSGDDKFSVKTPDMIFIQALPIPVPDEAKIIITGDPSISDSPTLYHRGTAFFPRPEILETGSGSISTETPVITELGPSLWKPVGMEKYLQTVKNEWDPSIIYDSTPDEDLAEVRNNPDVELVVLGNSLELFDKPRKFIEHVVRIKKGLGRSKLIYSPTLGAPQHIALLVYLGIDLFDTLPLIHSAREGVLLTDSGGVNYSDIKDDWYCPCMFCREIRSEDQNDSEFQAILGHNYSAALTELALVRNAIRKGTLRELVESRCASDLRSTNILRFTDRLHYDLFEQFVPVARKNQMKASTIDSLHRPEVIRFQDRVRERYLKPAFAKVLLLLPCSARKPYSFSRTHRLYLSAIDRCKNPAVVHEVILTSPLGIVPRELELAYPAQHYDIPVTGVWYEEERSMIRDQLKWLLDNFDYNRVIAHLDGPDLTLVEGMENMIVTGGENVTSNSSLEKLTTALNEAVADHEKISWKVRKEQSITALAMHHFGQEAGRTLTEGADIKGKYPYIKIFHQNKQLGMIEPETGLISMTLAGGERLLQSGAYFVEIEDFEMKGDVFAPAVTGADKQIRPIDEVVVYTDTGTEKKLKAVGRTVMNGEEMVEATRGRAVKVRHFVK